MLDDYDTAGLDPDWNPPRIKEKIKARPISSDLPRALDTAVLYSGLKSEQIEISPLFREIPLGRFRNPRWKLPSWSLLTLVRLGWLTGWMPCEESRKQTRQRVRSAADLLESRVKEYGELALYAHGFFLWLLIKELRRRGWQGNKKGRFQYLESVLFEHPDFESKH